MNRKESDEKVDQAAQAITDDLLTFYGCGGKRQRARRLVMEFRPGQYEGPGLSEFAIKQGVLNHLKRIDYLERRIAALKGVITKLMRR
jgi:hypothetical protein